MWHGKTSLTAIQAVGLLRSCKSALGLNAKVYLTLQLMSAWYGPRMFHILPPPWIFFFGNPKIPEKGKVLIEPQGLKNFGGNFTLSEFQCCTWVSPS